MEILKFQNRFIKTKYILLFVILIITQVHVLNQVGKDSYINCIRQDERVFTDTIKYNNSQIQTYNERLKKDTNLTKDDQEKMKNTIVELEKKNTLYFNLQRKLEKALKQLTFYDSFNDDYFDSMIDYLKELLEQIPETSSLYLDLSKHSYIDYWYEVIDLMKIREKAYTNEMYEVHVLERVYLNFLSYFLVLVFILSFILEAHFLESKKESVISFVPGTFNKRFIHYYGNLMIRCISLFVVSLLTFIGYLLHKNLFPLFGHQTVLYSLSGIINIKNFWVIYLIIVLGWILIMLMTAFTKEIISLWSKDNLISTAISVGLTMITVSIFEKVGLGLNVYITTIPVLLKKYGTALPLSNIYLCLFVLFIICIFLYFLIRYFYNHIYKII
ncbi:hypothetical protein IU402_06510 [Aerococcaceae bacterium zg-BR9]|uniref:hypothetical protein n=1 Tax=Aerococcaceae bacterium zg-1292 TaxID=2774330 RepID=UPI0040634B1A|nr:hypothetical protein [Aerococcaceae bacterium zg-BR9]